ncbi:hypothetical protein ACFY1L_40310 [Streptomyces sp. NPDC001663]
MTQPTVAVLTAWSSAGCAHHLQAALACTRADAPTEAANAQSRADALT